MITTKVFAEDIMEHPECIAFMYVIITTNMHHVLLNKADGSKESYDMWYKNCVVSNAAKIHWRTAIAYDDGIPCGYFQFGYEKSYDSIVWGEMEIDDLHKGDHKTFRTLIKAYLDEDSLVEYNLIQGYINNHNTKSQSVFINMGFEMKEETERGTIYTCIRQKIENWYK